MVRKSSSCCVVVVSNVHLRISLCETLKISLEPAVEDFFHCRTGISRYTLLRKERALLGIKIVLFLGTVFFFY